MLPGTEDASVGAGAVLRGGGGGGGGRGELALTVTLKSKLAELGAEGEERTTMI